MAKRPSFTRLVYLALAEQVQPVIDAYKDSPEAATVQVYLIDPAPIKKAVNQIHRYHFPQGAEQTYRETNAKAGLKAGFGSFSAQWLRSLREFITEQTLNTIANQITKTTIDWVGEQIIKITESGGSIQDLTRTLLGRFPRMRAQRIARTETIRARNAGHLKGYDELPFQAFKVWSSAQQTRTRGSRTKDKADHLHMNGQQKEPNEPFIDPRSGATLDAPGNLTDGSIGGAADVVNCFLPSELTSVNQRHIKKVFRSFYNGQVVTIKTSGGNDFTCTPNHPILTTIGWVAAGKITNGFDLINSDWINSNYLPEFNVHNTKTSFEQLYNSFSVKFMSMRVSGSIMYFYGDGSAHDVDIIQTERVLGNRDKFSHLVKDKFLQYTNLAKAFLLSQCAKLQASFYLFRGCVSHCFISFFSKFFPTINISLLHPQIHTFAPVALPDSIRIKPVNDHLPATSKMCGKFLDTETGFIHGHDFSNGVGISKVVSVRHSNYSGFVYTLETVNQIYDINGLIAKNCRCRVVFDPKRDADGRLIMKKAG